MTDPKTEALLKRFLEEDAAARAKGITIEALHKVVLDIAADRLIDRRAAMQDRAAAADDRRAVAALSEIVGRYTRRTHAIERQLQTVSEQPQVPDWRPDPREITGTHELAEIRRAAVRAAQHDDLIESRKWWREHAWLAIGALLLALAGGCGTYLAGRYAVTPVVPK